MRQQLWFARSPDRELIAQDLADTPMQDLTSALEQILISGVLNERVLEPIVGVAGRS
jgi:hypothetical protein